LTAAITDPSPAASAGAGTGTQHQTRVGHQRQANSGPAVDRSVLAQHYVTRAGPLLARQKWAGMDSLLLAQLRKNETGPALSYRLLAQFYVTRSWSTAGTPEVGRHGQPAIGPALGKLNWSSTDLLTDGPAL